MRFLGNTYDPQRPDAPDLTYRMNDETQLAAWRRITTLLAGTAIIGDPQPIGYTVAELKAMHMVGVYEPEAGEVAEVPFWTAILCSVCGEPFATEREYYDRHDDPDDEFSEGCHARCCPLCNGLLVAP